MWRVCRMRQIRGYKATQVDEQVVTICVFDHHECEDHSTGSGCSGGDCQVAEQCCVFPGKVRSQQSRFKAKLYERSWPGRRRIPLTSTRGFASRVSRWVRQLQWEVVARLTEESSQRSGRSGSRKRCLVRVRWGSKAIEGDSQCARGMFVQVVWKVLSIGLRDTGFIVKLQPNMYLYTATDIPFCFRLNQHCVII